ncbi:3-hydroxy-2-methylbutyryl-CoA dehydrogenase [Sulfitobacter sp. EhC04]|uniref:SDR family NAD(P)-dependent oxidoreductase n=1 Tax=Sulfitobacter sp. EhC04 TaxID=1849168 RepID=UPI0007F3420C|nr:SDR family NAD(P)-dependent oxidoreductase [Sulfitobacter sp. EhC04]OAN75136.1 3-hydroxy-2-methylbutyryl-CoA dehydrogenase [Sulfitobacter sp. EhC04]
MDSTFAVIVTGAASGLGQAAAKRLVQQGYSVAAVDLTEIDQQALPNGVKAYQVDVSDTDAVDGMCEQVKRDFGGMVGLVNCAGIVQGGKLVSRKGPHDADVFKKVISVNVIGTFNLMRAAVSHMAANSPDSDGQRGVVVNTSSIAAYDGQIGQIAYAASKGAVASMTLPAARDMANLGVRVVSIAPGIFDTPMLAGLPEDVRGALEATVPFPAKLADTADFGALVSHIFENKTLNGEVIRLDGALRMAPQ